MGLLDIGRIAAEANSPAPSEMAVALIVQRLRDELLQANHVNQESFRVWARDIADLLHDRDETERVLTEAIHLLLEHRQVHGHHSEHKPDSGSDWRFRRDCILDECAVIVARLTDR